MWAAGLGIVLGALFVDFVWAPPAHGQERQEAEDVVEVQVEPAEPEPVDVAQIAELPPVVAAYHAIRYLPPAEMIGAEVARRGLPEYVRRDLERIAWCESRWKPGADPRGPGGPRGLLQIMPVTWDGLTRTAGVPPIIWLQNWVHDPRLDAAWAVIGGVQLYVERGRQPWAVGGC